jgi:chromosome segregation ATPase
MGGLRVSDKCEHGRVTVLCEACEIKSLQAQLAESRAENERLKEELNECGGRLKYFKELKSKHTKQLEALTKCENGTCFDDSFNDLCQGCKNRKLIEGVK